MKTWTLRTWALVSSVGMALMAAGAAPSAHAQEEASAHAREKASAPAQEEECDDGDTRTSVVSRTITVNNRQRSYWLSVPPGGVTNAPLLVSHHGSRLGNLGCDHAAYTGWASYSIDSGRNFVAVYPNGAGGGWDVSPGSADVGFVRAVVAAVRAEVSVDPKRIYATGHSFGAYFAQRLACESEDLFASVATFAGGWIEDPCQLSRGIAVGLWHGDTDAAVPISLGRESRDDWAVRESCTTRSPATGEPNRVTWSGCLDNVVVDWTVLPGQDHVWPTGSANDTMRGEMWALFDAFPLP